MTTDKNRGHGNTAHADKPSPNIHCKNCGSLNTYTTMRQIVCRKCGARELIEVKQ